MKTIRYQSELGGLFTTFCQVFEGDWQQRKRVKCYMRFETNLDGTDGYGPCYFTLEGQREFGLWIGKYVKMIERRGVKVEVLREALTRYHYVDIWQVIPCLDRPTDPESKCGVCRRISCDWRLVVEPLR